MAEDLTRLQARYRQFIEERGWENYHTPKSTAMSVAIEAGELLEVFQWHDNLDSDAYDEEVRESVREELADVIIYAMSLAEQFDIDLQAAVAETMAKNQARFDEERVEAINERLDRWVTDGSTE